MAAKKLLVVIASLSIIASACGGGGNDLEATIAVQNTQIAELASTAIPTGTASNTPTMAQLPSAPTLQATGDQSVSQDWDVFRDHLIQGLNTLSSYKATCTIQDQLKKLSYQDVSEYVEPDKVHRTTISQDGGLVESVWVADRACSRSNGAEWKCQGGVRVASTRYHWIHSVIEDPGQLEATDVLEHGSRTDMKLGKQCRLFYISTLYHGKGYEVTNSEEICFGLDDLQPIQGSGTYMNVVAGETTDLINTTCSFSDINAPIQIVLPTPDAGAVKLYPYKYELKEQGDGWSNGSLQIAFENASDQLIGGESLDMSGAVLETQEGKTYPVTVYEHNAIGLNNPVDMININNVPRVIPPHFRWSGLGGRYLERSYFIGFRVATAAHPLRIKFPKQPDLTISLSSDIPPTATFPTEPFHLNPRPLSDLAGTVLADDPKGLRITLTGKQVLEGYGNVLGLEILITNTDKLDSHTANVVIPFIATFFPNGGVTPTSGRPIVIDAGPGQVKQGVINLVTAYDCIKDIYALTVAGDNQYTVYHLTACSE